MTAIFDDALIFKQPITIEGGLTQTGTSMPVLGDATGSPSYTLSKSATGTARIDIKAASVLRARFELDASENLVIANYDAAGALLGKFTFDNASGLLTSLLGMVIAAGGLSVSAGNITAVLGNIIASAGDITATLGAIAAGTTVTGGTGLRATTGGLTVSAGGATITGGLELVSGIAKLPLVAYADDAAAGAAGLVTDNLYKIGQTVTVKA